MSLYVETNYVSQIAYKLERFKKKGPHLWNFRCCLCGDSKKNKLKTRGYIYRKKNNLFYMCHNCGASMSLGNFIKQVDKTLYDQFRLDVFKEGNNKNYKAPDFKEFRESAPIFIEGLRINLPTITSLKPEHPAKQFLTKRKIPEQYFDKLYYAEDFFAFANEIFPGHGRDLIENDPRIVIPFYDEKNILLGVQGRTISNSPVRYITIKQNEGCRKIFGLDTVDLTKTVYVVEGPFDSMFIKNSIAVMDGALYHVIPVLGDRDYVFVFDNEPNNHQIVGYMNKVASLGQKLVVWPKWLKEKDINDIVLAGRDVQNIIDKNTHSDLRATLELNGWKKI